MSARPIIGSRYDLKSEHYSFPRQSGLAFGAFDRHPIRWPLIAAGLALAVVVAIVIALLMADNFWMAK